MVNKGNDCSIPSSSLCQCQSRVGSEGQGFDSTECTCEAQNEECKDSLLCTYVDLVTEYILAAKDIVLYIISICLSWLTEDREVCGTIDDGCQTQKSCGKSNNACQLQKSCGQSNSGYQTQKNIRKSDDGCQTQKTDKSDYSCQTQQRKKSACRYDMSMQTDSQGKQIECIKGDVFIPCTCDNTPPAPRSYSCGIHNAAPPNSFGCGVHNAIPPNSYGCGIHNTAPPNPYGCGIHNTTNSYGCNTQAATAPNSYGCNTQAATAPNSYGCGVNTQTTSPTQKSCVPTVPTSIARIKKIPPDIQNTQTVCYFMEDRSRQMPAMVDEDNNIINPLVYNMQNYTTTERQPVQPTAISLPQPQFFIPLNSRNTISYTRPPTTVSPPPRPNHHPFTISVPQDQSRNHDPDFSASVNTPLYAIQVVPPNNGLNFTFQDTTRGQAPSESNNTSGGGPSGGGSSGYECDDEISVSDSEDYRNRKHTKSRSRKDQKRSPRSAKENYKTTTDRKKNNRN